MPTLVSESPALTKMLKPLPALFFVSFLLTSSSPAAGSQIRLVGSGSTQCSGRVEIYHNNDWGTVCDDSWDVNDAKVVCRQLGCGTAAELAYFGGATGKIWLDNVNCSGNEGTLSECEHRGFGIHDCEHNEDAGVICSVTLPKPSISMNPVGEVTWGQDIGITCTIKTQHLGGTFTLQQTSGSLRKTKTSSTSSTTFSIRQVNFDHEGPYQCQYQIRGSSRDFSSPLSDSVRLSVTVTLPKPSISMNPVGEVTWGQNIGITCKIKTQHLGGTFTLQQTSGSLRKTETSTTDSTTFSIPQVNFDHEGPYQCQYQIRGSSRDFSSPLSDSVKLSVTVPLQQPNISLTSPDGGLVWSPEATEVTRGYSFFITCSVSSNYPWGDFSLIFSGSKTAVTKPAINHSTTFEFPAADYEHQGNYSCVYEVTLSSRKFISTKTTSITVIIKLSLSLPVSLLAAGSLVLLVLVVIYLVCKRRRQSQLAVRNHYVDSDNEEEEEQHYMNFEPLKKRQEKQTCGMVDSDEDHDKEESDEDPVYENAEGHCYVGNQETYFSVEDNREEAVYEDSVAYDDAYVSLRQSFAEDALDIYGVEEDIYQDVQLSADDHFNNST
ncbi:soluble scavenger receptor cysteine-rich domain-containing protein SSC5D-like isoform X2 [Seriola dumerili]|uniref:soluble scavenger receptor cysteine-rich domain-containing protein SSC5D-like isoform X2 n=1 Tax=Seriola dumerili TaxID=41447 RepID=UPI000BBE916C|nr:soluble scavenger receptor cysteine-rich domain-containing protein SSC5D-like isoform X2 [Seriola dumerili]